jgi:hypothetical protein
MAGTDKYYIEPNSNLQGYDILKRDGMFVDGKLAPERVCTIYSMDYLPAILSSLNEEDAKDNNIQTNNRGPVFEG